MYSQICIAPTHYQGSFSSKQRRPLMKATTSQNTEISDHKVLRTNWHVNNTNSIPKAEDICQEPCKNCKSQRTGDMLCYYTLKRQGRYSHDASSLWMPKRDMKNDNTNIYVNRKGETHHRFSPLEKELHTGMDYWDWTSLPLGWAPNWISNTMWSHPLNISKKH